MPRPDEQASDHFTYRDLCDVGETWVRLKVPNWPSQCETFAAMARLSREVLDALVVEFGRPTLTYGFGGSELLRHIKRRVAPGLDQHAGHELRKDGRPICPRLGQAVDLFVPGVASDDLARFIVRQTPFDRLYFYGAGRPIHVSVGPSNLGQVVMMLPSSSGRLVPKVLRSGAFGIS